MINTVKSKNTQIGFHLRPASQALVHHTDVKILAALQDVFFKKIRFGIYICLYIYQNFFQGVGKIRETGYYVVSRVEKTEENSARSLSLFLCHCSAVLFVSLQYFLLFKQVVDKIQNKEHLTRKGLEEIVAIKASINNGLPEELKTAFPNTSPKGRPEITLKENPDPN